MSGNYVRRSPEFKRAALRRMESCRNVSALARELEIRRMDLYKWRQAYQERGEAGLQSRPERKGKASGGVAAGPEVAPPRDLKQRVAELERLLGVKQLEVDFFKRTFEQVREAGSRRAASGDKTSTAASAPGFRSKGQD